MAFVVVFVVFLSFVPTPNRGFQVVQPQVQTVNPDHVTSIRCEHDAEVSSVIDVRLNRISPTGRTSKICPGTESCLGVIKDGRKHEFVLRVMEPEATACMYECEVTVEVKEDGVIPIFDTKKGTPTKLELGQQETHQRCTPPPPPPPPPPPLFHQLMCILIGLLVVMSLYSCLITVLFVRAKFQESRVRSDAENTTYVEMRKAPRPSNAP